MDRLIKEPGTVESLPTCYAEVAGGRAIRAAGGAGRRFSAWAIAAALTLLVASSALAQEGVTALTGATLHPVSGPPIPGGVLVIEGTTIRAVEGSAFTPPAGAEVIDLSGKHVYPGFVHPASSLGLVEIGALRATDDTGEIGEINPHIRAEVAVNADSLHLPVTVSGGVLTAHVVPGGSLLRGTSAVMRLEGWNWEGMTLAAPAAMMLRYPAVAEGAGGEDEDNGAATSKAIARVSEALDEARAYRKAREAADRGEAPPVDVDPRLEALLPVLAGQTPLLIEAGGIKEIESALDWAGEEGIEGVILLTGADAVYAADRLAEEEVPVILQGTLVQPNRDFEPYDFPFTAPATLHAAGVRFAIGDDGDPMYVRNLPFQAAMAAAFGLPEEAALKSVTLWPAEILGVADRVGSLEAGKEATFFVSNGDPLEITTSIERAWIAGSQVDMREDHQKRLYEKYRNRPRP